MDEERVETSTHDFWMFTCGVDTYRRSAQHARHDTPWNAFSPDEVLVCTLWRDQILEVADDAEGGRPRRFVKLGGKMREWKGPAVAQGQPTRQAGITAAIAWQFVGEVEPGLALSAQHPALAKLAAQLEATEAFKRFPPVGPGVSPPSA